MRGHHPDISLIVGALRPRRSAKWKCSIKASMGRPRCCGAGGLAGRRPGCRVAACMAGAPTSRPHVARRVVGRPQRAARRKATTRRRGPWSGRMAHSYATSRLEGERRGRHRLARWAAARSSADLAARTDAGRPSMRPAQAQAQAQSGPAKLAGSRLFSPTRLASTAIAPAN